MAQVEIFLSGTSLESLDPFLKHVAYFDTHHQKVFGCLIQVNLIHKTPLQLHVVTHYIRHFCFHSRQELWLISSQNILDK